jgi:site-specific DNA-methyltransferase (adenine-specific)
MGGDAMSHRQSQVEVARPTWRRDVIHADARQEWGIPRPFIDALRHEFPFDLDVAASSGNAVCERFYDVSVDGLSQPWAPAVCWCNPPFGRGLDRWLAKARLEAKRGATVVCFLPSNTDTAWFHEHVLGIAEIRWLRGRVCMVPPDGKILPFNRPANANILAIYRPGVPHE